MPRYGGGRMEPWTLVRNYRIDDYTAAELHGRSFHVALSIRRLAEQASGTSLVSDRPTGVCEKFPCWLRCLLHGNKECVFRQRTSKLYGRKGCIVFPVASAVKTALPWFSLPTCPARYIIHGAFVSFTLVICLFLFPLARQPTSTLQAHPHAGPRSGRSALLPGPIPNTPWRVTSYSSRPFVISSPNFSWRAYQSDAQVPREPSLRDISAVPCTRRRYYGITARLARRSGEVLGMRVTVARIAPSLLDLGRVATLPRMSSLLTSHVGEQTMPLVHWFSRDLLFPPPLYSNTAPYPSRFTPIISQDLGVKSRPNLFAHSLMHNFSLTEKYDMADVERTGVELAVVGGVMVGHLLDTYSSASFSIPLEESIVRGTVCKHYGTAPECKGGVKREIPEKTRRPTALSGTIFGFCKCGSDPTGNRIRLLASHKGEPVTIPGRVTPGFSHVRIVPDDATGRRVFSGISRFPAVSFRRCSILTSITLIGSQDLARGCAEPSDPAGRPPVPAMAGGDFRRRCGYRRSLGNR
ncbi:hypothetical protein PR048_021177 [Dryococelus australis]|uniref:Uncharacterized protein n=1 Tax=Dryococelus australis TaxID=614101 RepID=A0ABQ9GXJ4_9NEOP|nr:hypothetical protein PR048_021177 [Dryococelus australis]